MSSAAGEPAIIQGGMGVAVSSWRLANAVSRLGQLGVVSGTGVDTVCVRRLQQGDLGGHVRRALAAFPVPAIARRFVQRYFRPHGPARPFARLPMWTAQPEASHQEAAILANFAEVWLAKERHGGRVGINFLEKIQLPMLPSLFGALLAGVDYVLMGAGIPREIPGILDRLARGEEATMRLAVEDGAGEEALLRFDPRQFVAEPRPPLRRPKFLAIVASSTLAMALAKKATGRVDGFVVEGPTSGGHNAPPRGALQLTTRGEPVYGPRDEVDLDAIHALDRPFWLAGAYGHPEQLRRARERGAAGVQVGTAFAFCQESGMDEPFRRRVLERVRSGQAQVFTDPLVSPTGFPFKVAQLEGTVSDPAVSAARPRRCDLGYLRQAYRQPDGQLGYRCPAEPVEAYVQKGGSAQDTRGRGCLCNGLMAAVGLAQQQPGGYLEPALVTAGDDLQQLAHFLTPERTSYSAADVVAYVLGQTG
jgi:nitronate monooxygenase